MSAKPTDVLVHVTSAKVKGTYRHGCLVAGNSTALYSVILWNPVQALIIANSWRKSISLERRMLLRLGRKWRQRVAPGTIVSQDLIVRDTKEKLGSLAAEVIGHTQLFFALPLMAPMH